MNLESILIIIAFSLIIGFGRAILEVRRETRHVR